MSDELKMRGQVVRLDDTKEYGAKSFKKRMFVIETPDKYPQVVAFDLTKDNCSALGDKLAVGMDVTVSFNVRCREYEGRYYVNLEAWRIEFGQAPARTEAEPDDGNVTQDDLAHDGEHLPF